LFFSIDKNSGLSKSVADALQFLTGIPRTGVILLVIVISGLFTEVISNLSTASIFLPVLDSIVCLYILF
jgi:di/tricarboxylate transporter